MPLTVDSDKPSRTAVWFSASVGVAALTLMLMLATEPLLRLVRVRTWIAAVRDPEQFAARWNPRAIGVPFDDVVDFPSTNEINTRSKLFSARVIRWFWP